MLLQTEGASKYSVTGCHENLVFFQHCEVVYVAMMAVRHQTHHNGEEA